jgi:uncharacterized protein YfkK (UPF0435 family)
MSNEIARLDYDKDFYPQIRAVLNADKAPDTVLNTAVEYCKAAGLDIMRKPVAIISFKDKHEIVFTIQAITTIASRAGWCGSDEIVFSKETIAIGGKQYPAFGYQIVYKMIQGQRCAFTGPKVYVTERYKDSWSRAGVMTMYQKCVTAAALRLAFPEQLAHAFVEEEFKTEYQAVEAVDNSGVEKLKALVAPAPVKPEVVAEILEVIPEEEAEAEEIAIANDDEVDSMIESMKGAKSLEELVEIKDCIKANFVLSPSQMQALKEEFSLIQKQRFGVK